jgi:general secretion pathway protein A
MYESFYGLREKPFSLTPDPRYFYRSASHTSALELVQHGPRNHGLTVITGTSGTGKTTTCRTILESVDRRTFTSLVLNPYISREDLLRLMLQDFGVMSRDEVWQGRLGGVPVDDLAASLEGFLGSLGSLGARALVIVDEAQKLPEHVLGEVSRLCRMAEKFPLQVVLIGQLSLTDSLRTPSLRHLSDRVTIRYRLRPLTLGETASYVLHRLTVAGGGLTVTFPPRALQRVHRATAGNPRLINMVCDRALAASFAARATRIEPDVIDRVAAGLRLEPAGGVTSSLVSWLRRRTAAL